MATESAFFRRLVARAAQLKMLTVQLRLASVSLCVARVPLCPLPALKVGARSLRVLLLLLALLVVYEIPVLLGDSAFGARHTGLEDGEGDARHRSRSNFPGEPALVRRTGGSVDCRALVDGDARAQLRAHNYMSTRQQQLQSAQARLSYSNADYLNLECDRFLKERKYVHHTSAEEVSFPIAFSIIMYKHVEQFERLLRAVYRPQNLICVHVDWNAPNAVFRGVLRIAQCLNAQASSPRVLVPTGDRVRVEYGMFSQLEAELVCMRALLRAKQSGHKWKYLINLTGQEFPLRTNLELVRILRSLNGANLMEADSESNRDRIRRPDKIPHGLFIYKGSVFIVVSEGFVEFAINDRRAQDLLEFLRLYTNNPDEFYFSTLNHNPKILRIPGAYTGRPQTSDRYPFLVRLRNWGSFPCHTGLIIHGLCIWGVEDLPLIARRPELVANKFFTDFQPLTLDCLEEWYWNRTAEDYLFTSPFYVQHHNLSYPIQHIRGFVKIPAVSNELNYNTSITIFVNSSEFTSRSPDLQFYSSLDVANNHL